MLCHGDVRYPVHAAFRTFYLSLLRATSFLPLSRYALVLITFFFSLTGRFPQHRKIAR